MRLGKSFRATTLHKLRYIRFPIELEQFMMEGSYNKVLKARSEVPSDSYSLFVDILLGTVRYYMYH